MSLKFFADHCVSNSVIQYLRDAGHEVLRLKDHMPTDSSDSVVISKAYELDAILVSLNGDFADIVTYPPEKYKGIIALQVGNHPEVIPQLMSRLNDFLSAHSDMDYYAGQLFLAEVHRIRIRGQRHF
jgi:predicted nuclease of predicted toxin-antitoxin system